MIRREPKAIGLARSVVIAETAVAGAVDVVVVGAVETNVRVPRIVRQPVSVRLETNAVPLRQRPQLEVIRGIGRVAREVEIVPATIVVHAKIGHGVIVVRNAMSVAATNLDRSRLPISQRLPINQQRLPFPRRVGSMISVRESLRSNLKPLRRRPAGPARFLVIGLVRSPLRKLHEQRMLFCETVADQQIGQLRMNSFGLMRIPMCDQHPSEASSRHRGFRRPKRRVSPMKWWRPPMLSPWSKMTRHCVRVAAVAVVVDPVRNRGRHHHRMATKGPRLI